MQLSPILNLIGAVLIVTAIVLHIVCIATPYWAGTDSKQLQKKLEELKQGPVIKDPNTEAQLQELEKQIKKAGLLLHVNINYGLWKMCVHSEVPLMRVDFCAKWASETKATESGNIDSYKMPGWIRGVQAMAILGLLASAAAAVMSGIHLFVPSRGDRLRLLPAFICVTSFVAGAMVLCGDIILGAKYSEIMDSMMEGNKEEPSQKIVDLIESSFYLNWGFALDVISAALMLLAGGFYIFGGKAAQEGGLV